jgi:GNAT superfamily N-acetyltransferase
MGQPEIFVTDAIDPAIEEAVSDGLDRFNEEATGIADRRPLAVVVRDSETGETLGGALGRSSLGLLFLDLFHLPKPLRGTGLGTEVLRQFEAEGRRRGCRAAVLYTISFQAPGFYERNGWRRFGEIPCDPPGTSRVFMTKDLREDV